MRHFFSFFNIEEFLGGEGGGGAMRVFVFRQLFGAV